ncbi:MAG: DNA polymerase III subunit delta [Bacilli bacterium]
MISVVYGINRILIDKYIDSIIKENNIKSIFKFDLNESKINDVLVEANYKDLFNDKKAIIVDNALFLTSISKDSTDEFERYIVSNDEDNYMFLIVNEEKLDERKKIVKYLKENSIVKVFNKIDNNSLREYIFNSFNSEGYNIEQTSISLIIKLTLNNINLIETEIEKLKLYKVETKTISEEDVKNVVPRTHEDDIFKLVTSVINKSRNDIFSIYKDLISNNFEPIALISLLSNTFRLYYSVSVLYKDGYNDTSIATFLGVHPYRVKLAREQLYNYNEDDLLKLIERLADADYDIKSGKIDKFIALEMFFTSI